MTDEASKSVLDVLKALNEGVKTLSDDMRVVRAQLTEKQDDVQDDQVEPAEPEAQIDHLDEMLGIVRQSTMAALGFTTMVSLNQKKMAKRLEELTEQDERLENSK